MSFLAVWAESAVAAMNSNERALFLMPI
jgi:hypothetical protein